MASRIDYLEDKYGREIKVIFIISAFVLPLVVLWFQEWIVTPADGWRHTYFDNGQMESQQFYYDGKQENIWIYWHKNGQRASETHYFNDGINGLDASWHGNGQKKHEGKYKYNLEDGIHYAWYKNGQKKYTSNYSDGDLISASVWKSDGSPCPLTKFVNGTGTVIYWHENGRKAEEAHYKNGNPVGRWIEWDLDGNKIDEINFDEFQ